MRADKSLPVAREGLDVALLGQAVDLAVQAAISGQLPFGAVLSRGDDVLATGVNAALRDHDPCGHAEVTAVRAACRTLGTLSLAHCTLYSSCEPCPVCHTVAIAAREGDTGRIECVQMQQAREPFAVYLGTRR